MKASSLHLLIQIFLPFLHLSHSYSDLEPLLKLKSSIVGPSSFGLKDWKAPHYNSSSSSSYLYALLLLQYYMRY
ncbi:hypothetical protein LguiA_023459 [Lonicera macranthoides]